jgi:hypothetical protein
VRAYSVSMLDVVPWIGPYTSKLLMCELEKHQYIHVMVVTHDRISLVLVVQIQRAKYSQVSTRAVVLGESGGDVKCRHPSTPVRIAQCSIITSEDPLFQCIGLDQVASKWHVPYIVVSNTTKSIPVHHKNN